MPNDNIVRPSASEQIQVNNLQNSYIEHVNIGSQLEDRTPYNGTLDRFGDVRLRVAIIDNPEIKREQYSKINPLDIKNIINLNTGNVVLRWVDMPGGIIRGNDLGGKWEHNKKYEHNGVNLHTDINEYTEFEGQTDPYSMAQPENRHYSEWDISSRREMVQLTHPFIWQDSTNYCGFNYIPPVGSMVIVGFKKFGHPVILGYVPTHYAVAKPTLKPGELVMKGYGSNYIHWRQSDKLDMKVESTKGKVDLDDYEKVKKTKDDCTLWIRMNANDRFIKISANNKSTNEKTSLIIKPESIALDVSGLDGKKTNMIIRPDSVNIKTNTFTVEADTINLKATGEVKTTAGSITSTATGDNKIYGSKIYLN